MIVKLVKQVVRVTCAVARHNRHKKVLKAAKGYRGRASKCYRVAKQAVARARNYAYRDRRTKKRDFRRLWIVRINAAVRENGLKYSTFMNALKEMNIAVDRKMLAELAVNNNDVFNQIVSDVKAKISA